MLELSFILGAFVVVLGLFILVQRSTSGIDRETYQRKWQEIEQLAQTGGRGGNYAIVEADKLLDHALQQLHYRGESMADRLKVAQPRFRERNNVWAAHKLRNQLVHEADKKISQRDQARAMSSFRRALKDLGAL
jgi:hypothetical protein